MRVRPKQPRQPRQRWHLACALAVAGCATSSGGIGSSDGSGSVSDKDLARLPAEVRVQILTAHKSVDLAQSNLARAKVARDEAKQFHAIALADLDAAHSKAEAARVTVGADRAPGDDRGLVAAARNEDLAQGQVRVAQAKLDFAIRLYELRQDKVEEAEASIVAAKADVAFTKLTLLQRNGIDTSANPKALETRRQEAQEKLAESRARVAQVEGEAAQLQTAWEVRRAAQRVASRAEPSSGVAPAATPQQQVEMPHMKWSDPPRGGVNDTPSAPATPLSQQPRDNIAPPP